MNVTSYFYCLAILIVSLSNSKVQCGRINSSTARYTGSTEGKSSATPSKEGFGTKGQTTAPSFAEDKIISSYSKISSTKGQTTAPSFAEDKIISSYSKISSTKGQTTAPSLAEDKIISSYLHSKISSTKGQTTVPSLAENKIISSYSQSKISSTKGQTTVPNLAENKIITSSSQSKISSNNVQPSDSRLYNRSTLASTEKQDAKRSGIEITTTKSQNPQRSNTNVANGKVWAAERETSTQPSEYPASLNRNLRPSIPDHTFNLASNAQTSTDSTRSKPIAANWLSTTAEYTDDQFEPVVGSDSRTEWTQPGEYPANVNRNSRPSTPDHTFNLASNTQTSKKPITAKWPPTTAEHTDYQFESVVGSNSRTESTRLPTTEKWTSTPLMAKTSTKFNSRFATQPTTTERIISTSYGRNFPTTVGLEYNTTTESSATRAGKTTVNGDAVVFPSVNSTRTTDVIDNKHIIDAPDLGCPKNQKSDQEGRCRDVV